MSKRKRISLRQDSVADDSTVVHPGGGSSASGNSSTASSLYYGRLLKRSLGFCCCTATCCVTLPLFTGLVAFYAGSGRPPFSMGGRHHGVVDLSEQPALFASLNRSVNPCQNFYHFVCDGWLAQKGETLSVMHELAESSERSAATLLRHVQVPAVGAIDAVHKAALLMQKCLMLPRRPPRPEVLLQFMNSIGLTWPQPTPLATSDLIKLMVRLSVSWELNAVFELQLVPVPKEAGGRPFWSLSPSDQLSSWRWQRRHIGPEYLTRIRRNVEAFSGAEVTRAIIDSVFEADDEVLRMTNVYKARGQLATFAELPEIAPGFQVTFWVVAMNEVTRGYFEVLDSDFVYVSNARFLVALQRLLAELNTRKPHVVPLYISWYMLRTLAWTVAPDARELQLDSEPEREARCFLMVHRFMPLAAGKPFADSANWDVATIGELFKAAKREYLIRIRNCPWMDEASRHSAHDKMRSVRGVFPAPGLMWNASALQIEYECMPQDREAFFLPSLLEAQRCKHELVLRTGAAGETSSDPITWTSPAVYTVSYIDVYNSAVVMGSVLYPPIFQATGAHREVLNYAGLTFLFARLLFSAIDQTGSLRDGTGSLRPWWSNFTEDGFSNAVRCLEDLYQYEAEFIRHEISDAVATSVSFSAYERHLQELSVKNREGLWTWLLWALSWPRWLGRRSKSEFTDDQAFFMNRCFCFCSRGFSDSYSAGWTSPEEMINVPLSNSPDFWRAFGCRKGDAMRAEKSCQLI